MHRNILIMLNFNVSPASSTAPPFNAIHFQLSFILPNIIVCCSLTLTVWITISLIHYGIKTGKWRQLKRQNQAEKLNVGHIYTSIVFCGVMVMFYDAVGLVYMNTGFLNNEHILENLNEYCDVLSDLAYSAYACVLLSTALFFWLRQRIFFSNRLLNVNYNKCIKLLSFVSLFLTIALAIGVLTYNIYPDNHEATVNGCVYVPNKKMQIGYWVSVIIAIVLCQGMFWGLFVYALRSTRVSAKTFSKDCDYSTTKKEKSLQKDESDQSLKINNSSILSDSQASHNEQFGVVKKKKSRIQSACSEAIRSTMTKTLAAAVTTTTLDIFEQILMNCITKSHEHRRFSVMLASITLFIHFFLIILCFVHHKKMLTSFCYRRFCKGWQFPLWII